MIVKSELADEISQGGGIRLLWFRNRQRQMFFQSLKLVEASRRRIIGLRNENLKLQKRSRKSGLSTERNARSSNT